MATNKRSIQVYLNDTEYEYLKQRAAQEHRSMAQTLLLMAALQDEIIRDAQTQHKVPGTIKGISFSDTPIEDYREHY